MSKSKPLDTTAAEKRLVLISNASAVPGQFVPASTVQTMTVIRRAVVECGEKIATAKLVPHDTGRLIHTMDLLQQAMSTLDQALLLPHVTLPISEDDKMADV